MSPSETDPRSLNTLERWRPVVGYEGSYEVSDHGRVRSLDREIQQVNRWGTTTSRRLPGKLLALTADKGEYTYGRLQVKLCRAESQRTRLVHQLVAEAFLGPRLPGVEVAHRDGNPQNNRVDNLRYSTPAENTADKHTHGTMLRGDKIHSAKLTEADVVAIRAARGKIKGVDLARMYGVRESQISRILAGQRWGHLSCP